MSEVDHLEDFLRSWNAMKSDARRHFVYNYVKGTDPEDKGELVCENLGPYINHQKVALYLLQYYPDENISHGQVVRCFKIFRQLLSFATHFETFDDEKSVVGWEGFHQPGVFSIRRSELLQYLLTTPRLTVCCHDVDASIGDEFKLLDLLTDEYKFQAFKAFWTSRPTWDESEEFQIMLEVEIKPYSSAMLEAAKSNKLMMSLMNSSSKMMESMDKVRRDMEERKDLIQEKIIQQYEENSRLSELRIQKLLKKLKDIGVEESD